MNYNSSYNIDGYDNNNVINVIKNNCNNNVIAITNILIITLILYFGILIFLYYISLTLWSHHSYFLCIINTIKPHASRFFVKVMWNNKFVKS
jgi:hypothetical protein